ncbi:MAG: carbonic anhydrase [Pseudomonadota bacterium]
MDGFGGELDRKAADAAGAAPEPLPSYMVKRYEAWRGSRFAGDRAWYAQLAAHGQHPRAMVIAGGDSRVDVTGLLGSEPGELFTVRNVANICPPFAPGHEHHSTCAAIEYAVTALKVSHIVVLGHAHCGGVQAYRQRRDAEAARAASADDCSSSCCAPPSNSFIDRWMDLLKPAYDRLSLMAWPEAETEAQREAERQKTLEQEGVLSSLRNLLGFPFVREAVAAGTLTVHGAWFDIGEGRLHAYDPKTERFDPV